jgi:hypothetical protein
VVNSFGYRTFATGSITVVHQSDEQAEEAKLRERLRDGGKRPFGFTAPLPPKEKKFRWPVGWGI